MAIHVALSHATEYRYDRPVSLAPYIIRWRPAPPCRTPILSDALRVTPELSAQKMRLSVSNSSSGRHWELNQVPAMGDPTHIV